MLIKKSVSFFVVFLSFLFFLVCFLFFSLCFFLFFFFLLATSLLLSSRCCGDFALHFPEITSQSKSAASTIWRLPWWIWWKELWLLYYLFIFYSQLFFKLFPWTGSMKDDTFIWGLSSIYKSCVVICCRDTHTKKLCDCVTRDVDAAPGEMDMRKLLDLLTHLEAFLLPDRRSLTSEGVRFTYRLVHPHPSPQPPTPTPKSSTSICTQTHLQNHCHPRWVITAINAWTQLASGSGHSIKTHVVMDESTFLIENL